MYGARLYTNTQLFLLISHAHTHTHTGGSYYVLRLECFDGIIAVTSEEKKTEGEMERWMGMEGERERELTLSAC